MKRYKQKMAAGVQTAEVSCLADSLFLLTLNFTSGVVAVDEANKQQSYESSTHDQAEPSCETTSELKELCGGAN